MNNSQDLHLRSISQSLKFPTQVASRPIKILLICDNTASGYYRMMAPVVLLSRTGLIEYRTEPDNIDWADIVFWQRPSGDPEKIRSLVSSPSKKLIIELDDHYFASENGVQASHWTEERKRNLMDIAGLSHAILVSTPGLDKWWSDRNFSTTYIPHHIDATNSRWKVKCEKSPKTIGWFGGDSHIKDLELIHPNRQYENNIVIAGYEPEWAKTSPYVEYRPAVSLSNEANLYCDFEVGLVPLEDTEFNRVGKSDLKFLQYTMIGALTCASPVGMYQDLGNKVIQSTNLLNDAEEVFNTPTLFKKRLKRAQDYVLSKRTLYSGAHKWYDMFYKVL